MKPLIATVNHDRSVNYLFMNELPQPLELLTIEPEKEFVPTSVGAMHYTPEIIAGGIEFIGSVGNTTFCEVLMKEIKIEIPYTPYIDGWDTTPTRAERRKSRVRMNTYNRLTNVKQQKL